MSDETLRARTLKDYRPQHDDDCALMTCGRCRLDHARHDLRSYLSRGLYRHSWVTQPCSCGLDPLLTDETSGQLEREPRPQTTCHMCLGAFTEDQVLRFVEGRIICCDCYGDLPDAEDQDGTVSDSARRSEPLDSERSASETVSVAIEPLEIWNAKQVLARTIAHHGFGHKYNAALAKLIQAVQAHAAHHTGCRSLPLPR